MISKAVRDMAVAKLADATTGINPRFTQLCLERNIPVPVPGDNADAVTPFVFSGPGAVNVFQFLANINVIENMSDDVQYPVLLIGCPSARQDASTSRPTFSQWFGAVTLTIRVWFKWWAEQAPFSNNFEEVMDAFQESLVRVFNDADSQWIDGNNIIYNGDLSEVRRGDLTLVEDDFVRGSEFTATVRVMQDE